MAQKINIIIDQGTTFSTTFTVNDDDGAPIDFTSYTGLAQMRKHYTSSNSTSFTVSANTGFAVISDCITVFGFRLIIVDVNDLSTV